MEAETRSVKRVYSLEPLHTKRNEKNRFVILIMSRNISFSLKTGQNHISEHATTSIHHPYPYRLFFLRLITIAEVIRVRTAYKYLLFFSKTYLSMQNCKRITATSNRFKREMRDLPELSLECNKEQNI
jgi:hypothetical protein